MPLDQTASAEQQAINLDLHGRTAKAHLDKWQQYGEKAQQHATAAAILIVEAQDHFRATNQPFSYAGWLKTHGINPRTAKQLAIEHRNPDAAIRRRAVNRRAQAKRRSEFAGLRAKAGRDSCPDASASPDPHVLTRQRIITFARTASATDLRRLLAVVETPSTAITS